MKKKIIIGAFILVGLGVVAYFFLMRKNKWEGKLISGTDRTVYLVQDGKRRPIANMEVMAINGWSINQVMDDLPVDLIKSFPLGAMITAKI